MPPGGKGAYWGGVCYHVINRGDARGATLGLQALAGVHRAPPEPGILPPLPQSAEKGRRKVECLLFLQISWTMMYDRSILWLRQVP